MSKSRMRLSNYSMKGEWKEVYIQLDSSYIWLED